jgi:hypothetical protein
MNLVQIQLNLFKVVQAGQKKAIDGQGFGNKTDAKAYRNELNTGAGYNANDDVSGRGMPYRVSVSVDHWSYN